MVTVYQRNMRMRFQPAALPNDVHELHGQLERDRHLAGRAPDSPCQRTVGKSAGHSAVKEAHAIAVTIQHPHAGAHIA